MKRRNLQRWQKFYTAAGTDGMDKFHLWIPTENDAFADVDEEESVNNNSCRELGSIFRKAFHSLATV